MELESGFSSDPGGPPEQRRSRRMIPGPETQVSLKPNTRHTGEGPSDRGAQARSQAGPIGLCK